MQSPHESPENEAEATDDNHQNPSLISDFWRAMALLSRVPVRGITDFRPVLIARSVWCWPLVGLFLAGFALLPAMLVEHITGNSMVFAIFAVTGMVLLTGSMHEDGMADCADGFGGGHERARKLEIMRDSQIGTYGVVALILCFGLRLVLLDAAADIEQAAVLFLMMAVVSRSMMPVVMHFLPPARDNGLGKGAGRPGWLPVATGLSIALVITGILTGPWAMLAVVLAAMIATGLVELVARWQIGGQTGDVLGATQLTTELFVGIAFISVAAIGV